MDEPTQTGHQRLTTTNQGEIAMKALTLYELSEDYVKALDVLTDPEAELPMEAVTDTLEGMELGFNEKAVNVTKFVRNLEATAQAIKQAEDEMARRRKTMEKRAQWLKDYVKGSMEVTGISKIESPWFRLAVQNNPESVEVFDETMIPDEFKSEVVSVKIDKVAIRDALKRGDKIGGAQLVRTTRLSVR
jgi:hypothetical protein